MKQLLAFLALLLVTGVGAFAADSTWRIDPAHSRVGFTVTHMMISEVGGTFKDFSGSLTQKGDDFDGSSVEVTIKAASINTDNDARDNHLRSADFFDAAKYPEITFKSTSFVKTGKDTYTLSGNLTMHGVTKPVVMDAKLTGTAKNMKGEPLVGFKAATSVNRYDYDLKWNRAIEAGGVVVSRDVDITLNVQLAKQ